MNQKLKIICFWSIHNSHPSFWAKLGYSRIKIDLIADSLLKLQIKIGAHLINVELSQLLTPTQPTTHTPPGLQWATTEEIQHAHYFIVTCTMAGPLSLQQVDMTKKKLKCTTTPTATNGRQVYISIFLICNFDLIGIFLSFWLQLEACLLLTLPVS